MLGRSLATALVLTATVLSGPAMPSATPGAAARALCSAPPGRTVGMLADPEITEASGLAWSRAHRGVLWTHNDSGGLPRVYAVRRTGTRLGTVVVSGADAVDWEDVALGRGPGGRDHLFLGDIGGGGEGARSIVDVYRVPEPPPPGPGRTASSEPAALVRLRYPDGSHDAEALLVDDRSGDLVVVTKESRTRAVIYRAPGGAAAAAGSTTTLERTGELARPPGGGLARTLQDLSGLDELADQVTAADASAAAGVVVVRTYGGVAVHRWPTDQSLTDALARTPCGAPAPADLRAPQGEAIALSPDGRRYVTVSEGVDAPIVEVRAARP